MASLVIKLTWGLDEPERVAQALNVAVSAAAMSVPVSLWLTGEAIRLATPGGTDGVELAHSADFGDLMDEIYEAGSVTVCTQCAARRELTADDFRPGTEVAGAAVFTAAALATDTTALVY